MRFPRRRGDRPYDVLGIEYPVQVPPQARG